MKPRRILLKVSGEALGGLDGVGLDRDRLRLLAGECVAALERGAEVGIVMGGGNFLRGGQIAGSGIHRVTGDQMGMLATVINGLALRDVIEERGGTAHLFSSVAIPGTADRFDRRAVLAALAAGRVTLFAGGTGNPFFTTDSAAALRACELEADLFLKATKVDGVYDADPKTNPEAKRFDRLDYMDVVHRRLGVMDITAVTLCMENKIPIRVFDLMEHGSIGRVLDGENVGTLIN